MGSIGIVAQKSNYITSQIGRIPTAELRFSVRLSGYRLGWSIHIRSLHMATGTCQLGLMSIVWHSASYNSYMALECLLVTYLHYLAYEKKKYSRSFHIKLEEYS